MFSVSFTNWILKIVFVFCLWEPKMCRLAWQFLGMLGNVLGLLGMLRNVLGMLVTSSASSACFPQGPRSPTSKIKPPTCFLINCEVKGVVYHQASMALLMWEPKMCRLAWQLLGMLGNILGLLGMLHNVLWWYTTPLASQLIRQQVGGLSSMWDS